MFTTLTKRGKIFEVDSLSSHKCLGFSDNSSQNTKIAVVDNICSNIPGYGTIILNEFELNVRNKVQFIMAKINTANINSINFFTKNGYVKSSEDYITVNKDGKENNQGHIYYK